MKNTKQNAAFKREQNKRNASKKGWATKKANAEAKDQRLKDLANENLKLEQKVFDYQNAKAKTPIAEDLSKSLNDLKQTKIYIINEYSLKVNAIDEEILIIERQVEDYENFLQIEQKHLR